MQYCAVIIINIIRSVPTGIFLKNKNNTNIVTIIMTNFGQMAKKCKGHSVSLCLMMQMCAYFHVMYRIQLLNTNTIDVITYETESVITYLLWN